MKSTKSETRNPKQIQMTQAEMLQTNTAARVWNFLRRVWCLFRISYFVLRILIILTLCDAAYAGDDLRVMTFNIRYGAAKDGENDWQHRREILFKTIEHFDPDLLGMQEVLPFQADELKARLKNHNLLGTPRDAEKRGEMSPIMFRRDRFEKVNSGTFWLSDTPDTTGSIGWDAQFPRVVTWTALRDHRNNNIVIFYFNTHWDHRGVTARLKSAPLMRQQISRIAGAEPCIVTGDFNAAAGSDPYTLLLKPKDHTPPRLIDAYLEGARSTTGPTTAPFTFHGFTGTNQLPARIDWILHTPHFRALSCEIDHTNDHGRYPSDHFPVEAILAWAPAHN